MNTIANSQFLIPSEARVQKRAGCHPERAKRVEWVSQNQRDVSTSLDMTIARRSE